MGLDETINVMLVGKTGSGKSLLGNTLCGLDEESGFPFEVAEGHIKGRLSTEPHASIADIDGTRIRVIDTPGFFDSEETVNARWFDILKALCLVRGSIDAIILVMSIHHIGAGADCFKIVKEHIVECCTERVVIVFTFAEGIDESGRRRCIKQFNEEIKTGALGASYVFTDQQADEITISKNVRGIADILREIKMNTFDHIRKETLAKQTRAVVEASLKRITQTGDVTYDRYCDHMAVDPDLLPLFIEQSLIDDMIRECNENRRNEEHGKNIHFRHLVVSSIIVFAISFVCASINSSIALYFLYIFGFVYVCLIVCMIVMTIHNNDQ